MSAALGWGAACDPAPEAPTSLILVTLSEVQAQRLSAYGGPARTPALEAIAAGGVRFERAYTTSPMRQPAHASMFTGWYPDRHGLLADGQGTLDEGLETLAERLSGEGYRTAASVGGFWLRAEWGFDQGFGAFYDDVRPQGRPADEVVDDAVIWMAELGDEPFFLWVHLSDAARPWGDPGAPQDLDDYDRALARIDGQIARLEQTAGALGRPIAWIVAADGGAAWGGDRAGPLHEPTARVPLILRGAEVADGGDGAAPRVVTLPAVSAADVAPTAAGLLGLAPPEGVDGVDLTSLLRPSGSLARAPVRIESHALARRFGYPPSRAVAAGPLKWIDGAPPQLYDVAADPAEAADLTEMLPRDVQRLRAVVRTGARAAPVRPPPSELLDALPALGDLTAGISSPPGDLDPETARRSTEALSLMPDEPARAEVIWREILAGEPALVEARVGRARALLSLGRPAEAAAIYASLGDSTFARLQHARCQRAAGRPAEAAEILDAILAQAPDDPLARVERLYVQADLEGNEAALEAALTALDRSPEDRALQAAAGALTWDQGRADDARALLESSLADGVARRRVHHLLGRLALADGEPARAAGHLEIEIGYFPENRVARRELADLWFDQGAWARAATEYGRLIATGDDPDNRRKCADALYRDGRLDAAEATLAPMLRSWPRDPDVLLLQANILDERGDEAGSRRYFERARAALRRRGL